MAWRNEREKSYWIIINKKLNGVRYLNGLHFGKTKQKYENNSSVNYPYLE